MANGVIPTGSTSGIRRTAGEKLAAQKGVTRDRERRPAGDRKERTSQEKQTTQKKKQLTDKERLTQELKAQGYRVQGNKLLAPKKTYTKLDENKGGDTKREEGTYVPKEYQFDSQGNLKKVIERDDYVSEKGYDRTGNSKSWSDYEERRVYEEEIKEYKDGRLVRKEEYDTFKEEEDKEDGKRESEYDVYLKEEEDFEKGERKRQPKPETKEPLSDQEKSLMESREKTLEKNLKALKPGSASYKANKRELERLRQSKKAGKVYQPSATIQDALRFDLQQRQASEKAQKKAKQVIESPDSIQSALKEDFLNRLKEPKQKQPKRRERPVQSFRLAEPRQKDTVPLNIKRPEGTFAGGQVSVMPRQPDLLKDVPQGTIGPAPKRSTLDKALGYASFLEQKGQESAARGETLKGIGQQTGALVLSVPTFLTKQVVNWDELIPSTGQTILNPGKAAKAMGSRIKESPAQSIGEIAAMVGLPWLVGKGVRKFSRVDTSLAEPPTSAKGGVRPRRYTVTKSVDTVFQEDMRPFMRNTRDVIGTESKTPDILELTLEKPASGKQRSFKQRSAIDQTGREVSVIDTEKVTPLGRKSVQIRRISQDVGDGLRDVDLTFYKPQGKGFKKIGESSFQTQADRTFALREFPVQEGGQVSLSGPLRAQFQKSSIRPVRVAQPSGEGVARLELLDITQTQAEAQASLTQTMKARPVGFDPGKMQTVFDTTPETVQIPTVRIVEGPKPRTPEPIQIESITSVLDLDKGVLSPRVRITQPSEIATGVQSRQTTVGTIEILPRGSRAPATPPKPPASQLDAFGQQLINNLQRKRTADNIAAAQRFQQESAAAAQQQALMTGSKQITPGPTITASIRSPKFSTAQISTAGEIFRPGPVPAMSRPSLSAAGVVFGQRNRPSQTPGIGVSPSSSMGAAQSQGLRKISALRSQLSQKADVSQFSTPSFDTFNIQRFTPTTEQVIQPTTRTSTTAITEQVQEPIQQQVTTTVPTTTPKTPSTFTPFTPPPPTPRGPGFFPFLDKKPRTGRKVQGYNAFAKQKGKFVRVTDKPVRKENALAQMSRAVDQTSSRTGKIRKASQKVKAKPIDTYFRDNREELTYKRKKKQYVEKTQFAIDSLGELNDITVQGWKARRKRRSLF